MKKALSRAIALILTVICVIAALPFSVAANNETELPLELYYGRNKLLAMQNSQNLVAAYDDIGVAVKSFNQEIMLVDHQIPLQDAFMVLDIYNKDHPEDYYFPKEISYSYYVNAGQQYIYKFVLNYDTGFDKYAFKRISDRLLNCVSGATTECEKALMLYNIFQNYITYDYDAVNPRNSYGALVNGRAVCEGYAEAYQYLLQRLGIQAYIVTGENLTGEMHEWNLIRLDGKYYYSDATWDDTEASGQFFHAYFNITTQRLLEDHIIYDDYNILPNCIDTDMSYNYETVVTVCDVENIAALFSGEQKKTAHFFFGGTENNFSTWWQGNWQSVFYNIQGLVPNTNYTMQYRKVGREYFLSFVPQGYGVTVGGTLLSWGSTSDKTKVEFFVPGGSIPIYTTELAGNVNAWSLDNIAAGNYTVKITKADHLFKQYNIEVASSDVTVNGNLFLCGDVTEDGIIDIRDVARTKKYLAEGISAPAGDANADGAFNADDLVETMEKLFEAQPVI